MEITLTWHMIVMIVVTVCLVRGLSKERNDLDFGGIILFLIIVCLWAIYGGIFLW